MTAAFQFPARLCRYAALPGSSSTSYRRSFSRLPSCNNPCVRSAGSARRLASSPHATTELAAASLPDTQPPAAARRKRILSGVQPTGSLHLGNYLGAIRNWVTLQDLYDTYFCVVDLHAITLPHEPKELRDASRRSAAVYLACGIDPEKSNVFIQSHVPAHSELTWLLSCTTPIGWLKRMTQFKEKSKNQGEEVGTGLLTYPILMASDILLYQADLVPVGEDQMAHIELTRDVAERVNKRYGGNKWKKLGGRGGRIFRIPEGFMPPAGARVMSLDDGRKKMSKSAESEFSRVNLLDDADTIQKKLKRAKTDTFQGLESDNPERPEARNLITMYQLMTGHSKESIQQEVSQMSWGQFKPKLADAIIAHLAPIQAKYTEVTADPTVLDKVLKDGADIANEIANKTLEDCREAMGFSKRM